MNLKIEGAQKNATQEGNKIRELANESVKQHSSRKIDPEIQIS
jgi:hypothetical protein